METLTPLTAIDRARLSHGNSSEAIYQMVGRAIANHGVDRPCVVDVGCGMGNLAIFLSERYSRYIGLDAVRYEDFPAQAELILHDLNQTPFPLPDHCADWVISVETIEHLENPRALMREMVRLAKPGGLVVVTTPNQLSLLSKLTLVCKNQFNAFQTAPGLYPAHITALLEIDLIRIATEAGLGDVAIHYSNHGRIPFTPYLWPASWRFGGRWFSDNLLLVGRVA